VGTFEGIRQSRIKVPKNRKVIGRRAEIGTSSGDNASLAAPRQGDTAGNSKTYRIPPADSSTIPGRNVEIRPLFTSMSSAARVILPGLTRFDLGS
jgi:hypothetical protein